MPIDDHKQALVSMYTASPAAARAREKQELVKRKMAALELKIDRILDELAQIKEESGTT